MLVPISGSLQEDDTDKLQDCKGRTCASQTEPPFSVGDDQYPRQRAGKVEEKICVLDSGTAHRRKGSRERSMGCDTCESGIGRMGEGTNPSTPTVASEPNGWQCIEDSQLFFVDTQASASHWDCWMGGGMICYERVNQTDVLGENLQHSEEDGTVGEHRCFNCGSPAHFLTSCPVPHHHALINLSRQLAAFFQNHGAERPMQRIHIVEGWKKQRLEWLSTFQPGEIRGNLLREALGMDAGDVGVDAPWLKSMSFWGYPRGWVGGTDPREKMRGRILDDIDPTFLQGAQEDGAQSTMIIFDGDGQENLDLAVQVAGLEDHSEDTGAKVVNETTEPHRWASYPPTYFLYTLLPIYCGQTLPPIQHEDFSTTGESSFSTERQNVWSEMTSPPMFDPPPPPISPPPLPPLPPIPIHSFSLDSDDEGIDMDLSD